MFASVFIGRCAAQAVSRSLSLPSNSSSRRLFSAFNHSSSTACRCCQCTTAIPHSISSAIPRKSPSSSSTSSLRNLISHSSSLSSRLLSSSSLSTCCSMIARDFATYKITTGLVGVPVVENPHEVLTALYEETLKRLASYPKTAPLAAYNDDIQKLTSWRLKQVQKFEDVRQLEHAIGFGIIEDVIAAAEDELELIIRINETSWIADTKKETEEYVRANPHWAYDPMPLMDASLEKVTIQEYEKRRLDYSQAFWKDIDEEIRKEDEEKAKKQQAQTQANVQTTH